MTEGFGDSTYVTLGQRFRTPAHPRVVAALGRAVYSFLSLEELVTAILDDAGAAPVSESRAKMAGGKEKGLIALAERYRASPSGQTVAGSIDKAVEAFRVARQSIRNELLHAHPYAEGEDAAGNYLPGLARTAIDGKSWKLVSRTPEELLALATQIELAIDPLSEARSAVQAMPLSSL